jgi:hypothetical protein
LVIDAFCSTESRQVRTFVIADSAAVDAKNYVRSVKLLR